MSKIIYGSVNSDGSIESGIGFKVQKASKDGIYQITFDNAFTKRPTIVATQCFSNTPSNNWDDISSNGGDTRDNVVVIEANADSCRLKTGDSGGNGCWRNFGFIAIGE